MKYVGNEPTEKIKQYVATDALGKFGLRVKEVTAGCADLSPLRMPWS